MTSLCWTSILTAIDGIRGDSNRLIDRGKEPPSTRMKRETALEKEFMHDCRIRKIEKRICFSIYLKSKKNIPKKVVSIYISCEHNCFNTFEARLKDIGIQFLH